MTCATTTGNPYTGRSGSSHQLAAMPIPAVCMRRQAAEKNTPLKMVDDSQGSSVLSEAVAAGETDDRIDVGQSSASEADLPNDGSSDQESVDEETLLRCPSQVMESEAGTVAACSAHATTSCLLYTSPSPRDGLLSRMPSSA